MGCLAERNDAIRHCRYLHRQPVLHIDGLRVVIYPNDHRPAHAHVIGQEGEAVFILHCPDGPPELRESYRFSRPEVGRIRTALAVELVTLCDEWRKIHDHY